MGSVRVLLALAVVIAHAGLSFSVGGKLAVQLFYMISGFLMSFILVEKQSYASVSGFYASRYLRLMPVYLVILAAAALAYALVQPEWYAKYGSLPLGALVLLGISQASLFLMDMVMFSGVQDGNFVFLADFMKSDPPLFTGLLVPQAWTLSLELAFYLIAPFLLPRRNWVIGLFLASLALRFALIVAGPGLQDPWSYRFFPTELALFLGGALSHQYIMPLASKIWTSARGRQLTGFMVAATLIYSFVPLPELLKEAGMFALLAGTLPFLLLFQNEHRWDGKIGNLSYPIYINHMLVLNACEVVLGKAGITGKAAVATISIAAVIIVAWLLDRFVAQPVDRWRHGFRAKRPAAEAADVKLSSV